MNKHILIAIVLLIAFQVSALAPRTHQFYLNVGKGGADKVAFPSAVNAYMLFYQYTARYGQDKDSCQFKVFWNNDLLGWHKPYHYQVWIKWYYLKVIPNKKNVLKFVADGPEDGIGVSIDSVLITGTDGSVVKLINGDFESPKVGALPQVSVIPGWNGQVQIGPGSYYSPAWCKDTQVISLDGAKGHSTITQQFDADSNGKLVLEDPDNLYKVDDNTPAPPVDNGDDDDSGKVKYSVTFQYAALQNQPLTAFVNVYWNGKLLGKVHPKDYQIKTQTFRLKNIKDGVKKNRLQFAGDQSSDSHGLSIDNVKITGDDGSQVDVLNGDFQLPAIPNKGSKTGDIPGWSGQTVVGNGPKFNSLWPQTQVNVFNSQKNKKIIQDFDGDNNKNILPLKNQQKLKKTYTLVFQYAAREGKPLPQSKFQTLWNDVSLGVITPANYDINTQQFVLSSVKAGSNNLRFKGLGGVLGHGCGIAHVKLFANKGKPDQKQLKLPNADFQDPNVGDQIKIQTIPGWGGLVKIGKGKKFNAKWPQHQVIQLDYQITKKTQITQQPQTKKYIYTLVFQYAAREGKPLGQSKFQVFWNGVSLGVITPAEYGVFTQQYVFSKVNKGKNTLLFKGLGGVKGHGCGIGNVKLISNKGKAKQFVIPIPNGDFALPEVGNDVKIGKVPGWWGILKLGKGPSFNSKWPQHQVIELDDSYPLTQTNWQFEQDDGKWVKFIEQTKKYTYTLIFQYAARQGKPLGQSKFQVFWNSVSLGVVTPADYDVHIQQFSFSSVKKGKNNLLFKGLGGVKGHGCGLANVKLFSNKGLPKQFLIPIPNGNFALPHVGNQIKVGTVPGWTGVFKLGRGGLFNTKWPEHQVIELDDEYPQSGTEWQFEDDDGKWVDPRKYVYTLIFQYAARQGKPLGQSKFQVFWNGVSFGVVTPADYDVHTVEYILPWVNKGKNTLFFKGLGGVSGHGCGFANVKLISNKGSNKQFVIPIPNGNFAQPDAGNEVKVGKIPGWWGIFRIGKGTLFNSKWGQHQVAEVDKDNSDGVTNWQFKQQNGKWVGFIQQTETKPKKVYTLVFEYAARQGKPLQTSKFQTFWNDVSLGVVTPADYNINIQQFILSSVKPGKNNLKFKGLGGVDGHGASIAHVKLYLNKGKTGQKLIKLPNADFQDPNVGDQIKIQTIPGWGGLVKIGKGKKFNAKWPQHQVIQLAFEINQITQFNDDNEYVQPTPPVPVPPSGKKYVYTLIFQYAARQGKPLQTSSFQVYWGTVLVGKIVPGDYLVHTQQYILPVVTGRNTLKFLGTGSSDSFGAQITNVRIISNKGTGKQFNVPVNNGDFSRPNVKNSWKIQAIPGWSGIVQIGFGPIYNKNWKTVQVIQLDSTQNYYVTQVFFFNSNLKWISEEDEEPTKHINGQWTKWRSWNKKHGPRRPPGQVFTIAEPPFGMTPPPTTGKRWLSWNPADDGWYWGWGYGWGWIRAQDQEDDDIIGGQIVPVVGKVTYSVVFDYAAREGHPLSTSGLQVLWNGISLGIIQPQDYDIHTQKYLLHITKGTNKLMFRGQGKGDGLGATIDNVKILGSDGSVVPVINGQFELPPQGNTWKILPSAPGWVGTIELGASHFYNKKWPKTQVCELDADFKGPANIQIWQGFQFDQNLIFITVKPAPEPAPKPTPVVPQPEPVKPKPKPADDQPQITVDPSVDVNKPKPADNTTPAPAPAPTPAPTPAPAPVKPAPKYTVTFDYAGRQAEQVGPGLQTFQVLWNGESFGTNFPTYQIQKYSHELPNVKQGDNVLTIRGTGQAKGYKAAIDNVKITGDDGSVVNVKNGDFQTPNAGQGAITGPIPGWTGEPQVGHQRNYNKRWTSQVLQLDSNRKNVEISQTFKGKDKILQSN